MFLIANLYLNVLVFLLHLFYVTSDLLLPLALTADTSDSVILQPTKDLVSSTEFDLTPATYFYNKENINLFGPCFLFIGSTKPITDYLKDYRFLFDMAKEIKAAVVFVELRYFGESLPFGVDSDKSLSKLQFLSTKQILKDCVRLISHIKNTKIIPYDAHVIAYGSQVGGMLAAWLRLQYSSVVSGALASSAPVRMFAEGGIDIGAYYKAVTNSYHEAGCNVTTISFAFEAIEQLCDTSEGRAYLNQLFNLEAISSITQKEDFNSLRRYITHGLTRLAALKYPYETKMSPSGFLPAFAIKKACEAVSNNTGSDAQALAKHLHTIVTFYYNPSQTVGAVAQSYPTCIKPDKCDVPDQSRSLASLYLNCKELQFASCSMGMPNDMFPIGCTNQKFWESTTESKCTAMFHIMDDTSSEYANLFSVSNQYGFDFSSTTNLIFTSSDDPYSVGVIDKQYKEKKVFVLKIDKVGRAQELFQPNTCDPENLVNARYQIVQILKCWARISHIGDCQANTLVWDLPAYEPKSNDTICRKIVHGYPWGRSTVPVQPYSTITTSAAPTDLLTNETNETPNINSSTTTIAAEYIATEPSAR
uniref:Uncharacterized protein n=1 Tax=Ditylenchus dipsaci TaxID=166011 RepID=A0A915DAL2_9BILA